MKGYPVARMREIFCLWNLESWALNSKNPIQGIHNATYNWNSESKFHPQRVPNPVTGIQNSRLSWIT